VCELLRELRGSEVAGAGLDLASSFSAEAAGELIEVQLSFGHGRYSFSEVGKGEVLVVDDETDFALVGLAAKAPTKVS
jgi:hypothetical protein